MIFDSQRLPFGRFGCFLLFSRESGICDEMMERLRILDSQRLAFGESWMLLAFLVRIGNP